MNLNEGGLSEKSDALSPKWKIEQYHVGYLVCHKLKSKKELKEREAFDENRIVDSDGVKINFKVVSEIMERIGLIGGTSEGKIFAAKRTQKQVGPEFNQNVN